MLQVHELCSNTSGVKLVSQVIQALLPEERSATCNAEWGLKSVDPRVIDLLGSLGLSERSDLELNLVTSSELILDVRGWAEALEFTLHHDAHLGAEGLSLLHRVSRDNNSTLLALGGDLGHDVPHESLGLRINSG